MKKNLLYLFLLLTLWPASTLLSQQLIVPVVFHILHQGGNANIADAQVLNALQILNDDYNKRNADTINVVSAFANNVANMEVAFRLAGKDPGGNCTNGIEHIYTTATNNANTANSRINQWPPDKYLNIWIVNQMTDGIAGIAASPSYAATNPDYDGIMMINSYLGNIGTGASYTSRTLTHLTARYLNLLPFIGCNDDSVSDTPPATGSSTCDLTASHCNPPVIENTQNFLTYSYCSCMFTNGQKARLRACLANSLANRSNLCSNSNLLATGTNQNSSTACAPVCDFSANKNYACLGNGITFKDNTANGIVTSRTWTFQNANINTSTDSVVTVVFSTPGWQTVTLSVSNTQGSSDKTKTVVYVADTVGTQAPYYTSFENTGDFSNWVSINPDNDLPHFQLATNGSHLGNGAVLLNNYDNTVDGDNDELLSPAFDLTGLNNSDLKLSFWYSCANRQTSTLDSIAVYASPYCGENGTVIFKEGRNFINAGTTSGNFIPTTNSANWNNVLVSIPVGLKKPNVRFRIKVWGQHLSNNFYLDDFVVGPVSTDINPLQDIQGLTIYPNPANNQLFITSTNTPIEAIRFYDLTGWLLQEIKQNDNQNIDISAFCGGVYVAEIQTQQTVVKRRWIKL